MRPWIFNCTYAALSGAVHERLAGVGKVHPYRAAPRDETLEQLRPAHALFGTPYRAGRIDAAFLDALPSLRVIAGMGVGYDGIDVQAATARGVAVCNAPGVLDTAVAELTVALILMLARRLGENERYVRSGAWTRGEEPPPLGSDVSGKTLGVVGFGRIGRQVTRHALGLGMRATWCDVFREPPPNAPPAEYRPLDRLLREADFVTLHTDLNDSSRHLIGARELALMKPTAYLVNMARGGVVDQAALTAALQDGTLAGAGLDCLAPEPPLATDDIVRLPNVIALPHVGAATHETREALARMAADNVVAVLTGRPPRAIVNPEVLGGPHKGSD